MFTIYTFALFIHIVGALGMFAAIGIEWLVLTSMRRAENISTVKQWFSIMSKLGKLHGPSGISILVSGIYMTIDVWGFQDWISATFALLILMMIFGMVVSGRRFRRIGKEVMKSEKLNAEIKEKLNNQFLLYSIALRTAAALEIILLMTVKPNLFGAFISSFVVIAGGYFLQFLYIQKKSSTNLVEVVKDKA